MSNKVNAKLRYYVEKQSDNTFSVMLSTDDSPYGKIHRIMDGIPNEQKAQNIANFLWKTFRAECDYLHSDTDDYLCPHCGKDTRR